jgi:hypothetical protein
MRLGWLSGLAWLEDLAARQIPEVVITVSTAWLGSVTLSMRSKRGDIIANNVRLTRFLRARIEFCISCFLNFQYIFSSLLSFSILIMLGDFIIPILYSIFPSVQGVFPNFCVLSADI